jgi:hypothetical protein
MSIDYTLRTKDELTENKLRKLAKDNPDLIIVRDIVGNLAGFQVEFDEETQALPVKLSFKKKKGKTFLVSTDVYTKEVLGEIARVAKIIKATIYDHQIEKETVPDNFITDDQLEYLSAQEKVQQAMTPLEFDNNLPLDKEDDNFVFSFYNERILAKKISSSKPIHQDKSLKKAKDIMTDEFIEAVRTTSLGDLPDFLKNKFLTISDPQPPALKVISYLEKANPKKVTIYNARSFIQGVSLNAFADQKTSFDYTFKSYDGRAFSAYVFFRYIYMKREFFGLESDVFSMTLQTLESDEALLDDGSEYDSFLVAAEWIVNYLVDNISSLQHQLKS